MKVLFLFGPNLGALGTREPETYGSQTLDEIMGEVGERGTELGHEVVWRQSDHEGELVGLAARGRGRGPRRGRAEPRRAHALLVRAPRRRRGLRACR